MSTIDGERLKEAMVRAQESFEGIRSLTEDFIRDRIREYGQNAALEENEITEKVFQQLGRALCSYDKDRAENPFSWFMTVVDHRIIDYCRTHKVPMESLDEPRHTSDQEEQEPQEHPDTSSQTPNAAHRQLKDHEILMEAMSKLASSSRREMLLLVTFFPHLSYKEIATVTRQQSEDAAKQLKYNTMKEMREILGQMGYGWEMFGEMFRME
jgi:RNA polymerase sigma factor (sigma-70 family)